MLLPFSNLKMDAFLLKLYIHVCGNLSTPFMLSRFRAKLQPSFYYKFFDLFLSKMQSTTLFCSECLGTSEKNSQGEHESLISCSECGSSVHPSCLKRAGVTAPKQEDDWLCSECKSCNICGERAEIVSCC